MSLWSSLEINAFVVDRIRVHEKVQSVLESKERTQSGRKGQRYSKLAPELKAENQQASKTWLLLSGYTLIRRWVWLT